MIQDYKGHKHKIKVFESKFRVVEELKTELIQKNQHFYVFVFSALNYIDGAKKKTYIFVRKPVELVEQLIHETVIGNNRENFQFKRLINSEEYVQIVVEGAKLVQIKFVDISRY